MSVAVIVIKLALKTERRKHPALQRMREALMSFLLTSQHPPSQEETFTFTEENVLSFKHRRTL